jgi:hypothetical protein
MIQKLSITLLIIGSLWVSSSSAGLISRDLDAFGDGLLTYDGDTGLEWLDLTETTNHSWNAVVVSDALGYIARGFFAPSVAQVTALFINAGAIDTDLNFLAGNYLPSLDLIDLVGCTGNCSGQVSPFSDGLVEANATQVYLGATQALIADGTAYFTDNEILFGKTESDPVVGVWLVREASQVPEPNAIALIGVGLATFGFRLKNERVAKAASMGAALH